MEVATLILAASALALVLLVLLIALLRRPGDATAQFSSLALEVLDRAQKTFLDLAETRFKALTEAGSSDLLQKKSLIDQQLNDMKTELGKVSTLVNELEKEREKRFAELTTNLKTIGEQTTALTTSTNDLRQALANPQARGQWGERMAEDVLRAAGFVEGVNYRKQATLETGGARPDFTFILPRNLTLNMDVKFPFDNYMRYLAADSDADRQRHKADFLRDVQARIREITSRDYVDPGQSTVDYVLLFIPNEGVFTFIHEEYPGIFDMALQHKVVCCSPLTLFAVLAVVRQAMDNFALEQTSNEILSLLGQFNQQWKRFGESVDTLGNRLTSTQKAFDSLSGTRRRALDRPLSKIEALRQRRGIPVAAEDNGEDDTTLGLLAADSTPFEPEDAEEA